MNAQAPETGQRDPRLAQLHEAIAALEAGDQEAYDRLITAVSSPGSEKLALGVATLARRVHEAIHEIDIDSRLSCITGRDIPDARSHLDYVVQMTEQAAHKTLDLVDASRGLLDQMQKAHAGVSCKGEPEMDRLRTELRMNLSELSQAQEYQDLSGQLIRKVIKLVQDIENALGLLLKAAGQTVKIDAGPRQPVLDERGLAGPNAPQANSQQDADQLLADLGF